MTCSTTLAALTRSESVEIRPNVDRPTATPAMPYKEMPSVRWCSLSIEAAGWVANQSCVLLSNQQDRFPQSFTKLAMLKLEAAENVLT